MTKTIGKIGKNPQKLKEFITIREEISKLNHPARPDIDWQKIETLYLALLQNNGCDLQSLAYYNIALVKRYNLQGLLEGLSILDMLISQYWLEFWPEQINIRVEIIAWLIKSIQQFFRTCSFSYTDLPTLYAIEKKIDHLDTIFQKLEIRHLTGINVLSAFISKIINNLERLEQNLSSDMKQFPQSIQKVKSKSILNNHEIFAHQNIVSFNCNETNQIKQERPIIKQSSFWKGFITGSFLFTFISSSIGGYLYFHKNNFILDNLFFPQILSHEQKDILKTIKGNNISADQQKNIIQTGKITIQQINNQSLWAFSYGNNLLDTYHFLFPEDDQLKNIQKQWEHSHEILASHFTEDNSFQNAQSALQSLIEKLNTLDERHGKYITVSELKTIMFSIQKPFLQNPPLELLLWKMKGEQKIGKDTSLINQQINNKFLQMLNYYYLLQENR